MLSMVRVTCESESGCGLSPYHVVQSSAGPGGMTGHTNCTCCLLAYASTVSLTRFPGICLRPVGCHPWLLVVQTPFPESLSGFVLTQVPVRGCMLSIDLGLALLYELLLLAYAVGPMAAELREAPS